MSMSSMIRHRTAVGYHRRFVFIFSYGVFSCFCLSSVWGYWVRWEVYERFCTLYIPFPLVNCGNSTWMDCIGRR